MKTIQRWFLKINEGVAAVMLATLFLTFLVQVFSRYILASPFGWTLEVCLTLWLWLVFWTNATVLKHREHVIFDVIYYSVNIRVRRIFALIGSVCIIIVFAISFFPTWDFIDFLKIKRSPILQVPMRTVFSVYMLFLLAVIGMYGVRVYKVIRFGLPDESDHSSIEDKDIGG